MISFIVPTVGRPSLVRTLKSIELWPGDEILLVGDKGLLSANPVEPPNTCIRFIPCPPGGDWGHTERNAAMPLARGRYIAHIDDDDAYAPSARAAMADAIVTTPRRPVIFRMRAPNGITLWREPRIECGNLGTPCFLHPNEPAMLGTWGSFVGGDCHFLETSGWAPEDYVFRSEVIALVSHNWG